MLERAVADLRVPGVSETMQKPVKTVGFSIFWDFGSKMRPRCAKIGQDRTKMSQKRRKMTQDRLLDGTKISQDGAKLSQDAAKMAQDSAKSRNFNGFGLSLSIQKPMKTDGFKHVFN